MEINHSYARITFDDLYCRNCGGARCFGFRLCECPKAVPMKDVTPKPLEISHCQAGDSVTSKD